MGQITPESGAIALYDWIEYQQGIKTALEAVNTAQSAINSAYAFRVETNLYHPTIASIQNQALVNILIEGYDADKYTSAMANHMVTFHIDCYVLGRNENSVENPGSLLPADQVAVERLQYLCAQVEYGLRNMANYDMGLDPYKVQPKKLGLKFQEPQDVDESAEPYAPARFTFTCEFGYDSADSQDTDLTQIFVTVGEWSSRFTYS